jgi:hypothetical protein
MNATMWKPMLVLPVSPERDHIQGSSEAPLTLVEYGDYESCDTFFLTVHMQH